MSEVIQFPKMIEPTHFSFDVATPGSYAMFDLVTYKDDVELQRYPVTEDMIPNLNEFIAEFTDRCAPVPEGAMTPSRELEIFRQQIDAYNQQVAENRELAKSLSSGEI